jgi:hypothetical protein
MIQEIAKTQLYQISVDVEKNRLYHKALGRWIAPVTETNYIADIKAALNYLKPGFTAVNDVVNRGVMSPEWTEVAQETRQLLVKAGIKKSAEVISENVIQEYQIKRISRIMEFPTQFFTNIEDASAWLDGHPKK